MRRLSDTAVEVDDIDRQLMELVAVNPRRSNVSLGAAIGVTDETVASRLNALMAGGVLAMTALVDWEAAGYGVHALARLQVADRPPAEVAKRLVGLDGVHIVTTTSGCCDLVVGLLATDTRALRDIVTAPFRALDDIVGWSVEIVTETLRFATRATTLAIAPWSAADLPDPVVPLDDLDIRLIDLLVEHAHESNRWLSRRLGVSDGTVKAHIQRLEDAGLLRVAAVTDLVRTGEVGSVAFVFITLRDATDDATVEMLAKHPHLGTIERCVGHADLVAMAVARNENDLQSYLSEELRSLPGVHRIEVASVLEAQAHRAHLVRML